MRTLPRLRLAPLGLGKGPGRAEALGDDPFVAAGLYEGRGPRRVLPPPLGPGSLTALVEFATESNILPQCIRAFEMNVDGFGHRLDWAVPEAEVPRAVRAEAEAERARLEEFFAYAFPGGSFVALRRRTRQDMETVGIGYWEVVRGGEPTELAPGVRALPVVELHHVPAHTVRMTTLGEEIVPVTELRRRGLELRPVKVGRRFRAFVQLVHRGGRQRQVWFKEFGDPRFMDLRTGEYTRSHNGRWEANELIAFPVRYWPLSPYSLPRWIGNLPSVLGSRAAEEVNLLFFDNKAIPPLVITVSGGQLTKGTVQRIREVIEHEIKGRENFHKALILEALPLEATLKPGAPAPAPRIEVKPLTSEMLRDAMFMGYDDANRTKVRSSFGLAPLFTGETHDYTRATAEISRLVVEEQVFRPERVEWDAWANRRLMPALGARYWRFVSNGPNVTLNEDLIAVLTAAETAGAMTPNLARRILADVMEQEVPRIEEPWGDLPFTLTLAEREAALRAALGLGGVPPGALGPLGARPERLEARAWWRELARRLPRELTAALLAELRPLVTQELERRLGDRRRAPREA